MFQSVRFLVKSFPLLSYRTHKHSSALPFLNQYIYIYTTVLNITTCACGDTICPHSCTLQPSSSPYMPYACGAQHALCHEYSWSTGSVVHINYVVNWTANQSGLVTLTFDLESGVRVTCDVGYLCAHFSLHRPLCSQLRPYVCDRQTSDSIIT